ncbi:hypothetical protein [Zavarzinia compransoris]|uniref:Uncharacterized protein n=1 Tax=Zavarzinia compransoris TaxID=1264899 RepID=A0A317E1S9_9PROT|nr:hypothetical protein [Zavarzinia compransoris]PWR20562.1 hypothetical protein DKG75_11175 [Zavarzinia compransoris]TDP43792.1 hypothetical protein DES42_10948 [Zavarzinia compransoris]
MSYVIAGDITAAPAITIEVDDITAGIALRERSGYRFVASDPRFRLLDGSQFRRLHQIEAAARNLVKAHLPFRRFRAA